MADDDDDLELLLGLSATDTSESPSFNGTAAAATTTDTTTSTTTATTAGGGDGALFDLDTLELVRDMLHARATTKPAAKRLWHQFEVTDEVAELLEFLALPVTALESMPLPSELQTEYFNDSLPRPHELRAAHASSAAAIAAFTRASLAAALDPPTDSKKRKSSKLSKFRSRGRKDQGSTLASASADSLPIKRSSSHQINRKSQWFHQSGLELADKLRTMEDSLQAVLSQSTGEFSSAPSTPSHPDSPSVSSRSTPVLGAGGLSSSSPASTSAASSSSTSSARDGKRKKSKRSTASSSGGGSPAEPAYALDSEMLDAIAVLCASVPETPRRTNEEFLEKRAGIKERDVRKVKRTLKGATVPQDLMLGESEVNLLEGLLEKTVLQGSTPSSADDSPADHGEPDSDNQDDDDDGDDGDHDNEDEADEDDGLDASSDSNAADAHSNATSTPATTATAGINGVAASMTTVDPAALVRSNEEELAQLTATLDELALGESDIDLAVLLNA